MSERAIFDAALEIADTEARRAFVAKACAGNSAMQAAVESLLRSHDAAGSFLEVPAGAPLNSDTIPSSPESLPADAAAISEQTQIHPVNSDDDDEVDESQLDLSFLLPSNKPGSIGVLGHYEVQAVLGQGAFGIVFKAFDEKLHRLVAIKVMNPQLAATSPPRKRFLREARAAAAIRHENVVQVYSVEEQPLPYLVMEFIDGQTLKEKLDGCGPLEPAEILHIGRQIASGLAAAQSMGLIHRDIKPANILLEVVDGLGSMVEGKAGSLLHRQPSTINSQPRVKISDFGLARAADDASLTQSGVIAGTPMYMAPEQATGQTLDHRSDLFSFGSVLYQMASGRPPFRAANTVAVLRRVVEDTPRSLQEILPEIPAWLVVIVNKLLAKKPDERFQSAKEVADLLGRCQLELQLSGQVTCVNVDAVRREPLDPAETLNRGSSLSEAHSNAKDEGAVLTIRSKKELFWVIAVGVITTIMTASFINSLGTSPSKFLGTLFVIGAVVVFGRVLSIRKQRRLRAATSPITASATGSPKSGSGDSRTTQGTPLAKRSVLKTVAIAMVISFLAIPQLAQLLKPAFNAWMWPPIPMLAETDVPGGLLFDGKDDYVEVGPFDWAFPQFTIEAFVTSDASSDNGTIACLMSLGDLKKLEWMSLYDGNSAAPGQRVSGAAIRGTIEYASAYGPFAGGVRQHRVLVFDGYYMHYYINGIWQGKRRSSAHIGMVWQMKLLRFGCDGGERRFFQGKIDQVRISKVARYNNNFAPITSVTSDDSTLALYNFDEGEGDVLKDASGNGHDGKINGATWVARKKAIEQIAPVDSQPTPLTPAGRDALVWVIDHGGRVFASTGGLHPEPSKGIAHPSEIPADAVVGNQYFTDGYYIAALDAVGTDVTDDVVPILSQLPPVGQLVLVKCPITDSGLRELAKSRVMRTTKGIVLEAPQVTDRGVEAFRNLTSLEFLGFRYAKLSDVSLKHIQGLPLVRLELTGYAFSRSGFESIASLKTLTSLTLNECDVDDSDLLVLSSLQNLEVLSLHRSRLTREGLEMIANLPKLSSVMLADVPLDDVVVQVLEKSRHLQYLDVIGTGVSETGAQKLAIALPACRIRWGTWGAEKYVEPKVKATQ